jgi:hypothetical protein
MAAWTLTEAREHLEYWKKLDIQLTQTGQYFVFSTRTRQDVHAKEVRANLKFFGDLVETLEAGSSGGSRFVQVVPR